MGFLGTILNIAIAIYVVYFGYVGDFNIPYLLIAAVGFMVGHVLRKTNKSTSIWETRHTNIFMALIYNFLFSLLLVAIFFALGWGIQLMLEFRPEEGSGLI